MSDNMIECPFCGHRFNIVEESTCQSCPLKKNCNLVCCPVCGYQVVDLSISTIASLIGAWFFHRRPRRRRRRARHRGLSLADVPAGCRIRVIGFAEGFPSNRRAHLQAYGLVPDYTAEVLQQTPVTIIKIDHTEIALETELAALILVRILDRCSPNGYHVD